MLSYFSQKYREGGYSGEDPPLPIPNREVKLTSADGTATPSGRVGSRRSSRSLIIYVVRLLSFVYIWRPIFLDSLPKVSSFKNSEINFAEWKKVLTFAALSETKGSSLKELETTKYKQVPILTRLKSRKEQSVNSFI